MAFIPNSNSVVAFQSDPTKLVGTMSVVGLNFGNSSVILAPTSVAVLQGTTPWQVNVPSPSTIAYQLAGSVMAVSGSFSATPQGSITAIQLAGSIQAVNMPSPSVIAYQAAGSIMAVNATVNTGNSSVQLLAGVAAIGSVAVLQGTNPWQVNVPTPSYIAYQLAGSIMAVNATVNTGNSSVQLLGGVAVIGSVATLQGTNPWVIGNSSVQVISSVAAFVTNITASIAANLQSTNASVISYNTVIRNDTLASILGVDLTARPMMGDSQGRVIIRPFVPNDATLIEFAGSVVSTSVTLIQASVTGKRSYITDIVAANSGSVATIIQIKDGSTSLLGTIIAPGGGGTNPIGLNLPWRTAVGQDLTFTPFTAASVLYMTVRGYQGQ